MASPPFNPEITVPQDTDIVSQFPARERAFRDLMNSWLLVGHDDQGRHKSITLTHSTSPSTPASGYSVLWIDSANGNLKMTKSDGTIHYVGVPPGAITFTGASTADTGWALLDGTAISRTSNPELFARFGTTFGPGNGATTFNLPNVRGRVVAAPDPTGTILTSATMSPDGNTLGATGGTQTHQLTLAQIPTGLTVTGSISVNSTVGDVFRAPSGVVDFIVNSNTPNARGAAGSTGTTATITSTGTANLTSNNTSGATHLNIQPTFILNIQVKLG